jgi:hypothetical protein
MGHHISWEDRSVICCAVRQWSRVTEDLWPYLAVSSDTAELSFRCPLTASQGLRWRYSNPHPHGESFHIFVCSPYEVAFLAHFTLCRPYLLRVDPTGSRTTVLLVVESNKIVS